jgi:hypothetical protein
VDKPIELVQSLSPSTPQSLVSSELLASFDFLFGNDSNEIETPQEAFSSNSTADFGAAISFIAQQCTSNQIPLNCGIILALPLLVFQPNSHYVSGTSTTPNSLVQLLTTFALPSIPNRSILVYLIVSTLIFFWCVGGLVLALFVDTPATSNFDCIDFAARIIANQSDGSFMQPLLTLTDGRDTAIREALEDKVLFVRDVGVQEVDGGHVREGPHVGKIGFTMNGGESHRLLRGASYA